ncbi:SDR family NAD(P)-dependent oxidoreductase [Demequina salsinemoris]|uniref:SDR family NAD(P)-dependent oxidoreductase n=1 Tax=Demequina salsinemoris TaxID=577470 RepID=UPI000781E33D|nr:SDR family NAD(P)-dependent oxidoreductase [Demequina salsinemoris]
MTQRTAVVTGASSGIGEATARQLAADGWHVVLGARRLDRLEALAAEIGGTALALDVTDPASVEAFCAAIPEASLLVANAGGAFGTTSVADADEDEWQRMYDVNVLGTVRTVKALLPKLIASGDGQVVTLGSIAALEPYPGGAGYNAAKHAVKAFTRVLRLEMKGQPIRVSEIDPGLVETEFSMVRFDGDQDKADKVYAGMTPLVAQDIAEAIAWVASRPAHVNIDSMLIMPRAQVSAQVVHREL